MLDSAHATQRVRVSLNLFQISNWILLDCCHIWSFHHDIEVSVGEIPYNLKPGGIGLVYKYLIYIDTCYKDLLYVHEDHLY